MSERIGKITAIITRKIKSGHVLLLLEHPTAGIQIPAGTVDEEVTTFFRVNKMFTNKITTLIILSMAIPSLFACSGEQNLLSTPELQTQRIESSTSTQIIAATNTATTQVTPTPTPTQIPTATNTATIQVTPTPTFSEGTLLGKDVIAILEWDSFNLFLIDINTGYTRQLNQTGVRYGSFSWLYDGCEIIVHVPDIGVVSINLDGSVNRELITYEQNTYENRVSNISLSPSEPLLAYLVDTPEVGLEVVGGFERGTSSGYVEMIHTDTLETYRVSENAGATEISWSLDGSKLAYPDIDQKGVHQLFVSTPDGSEQNQLTYFDEKYTLIRYISWSPNGKSIAFNTINMETYSEEFMIVSLSGEIKTIDLSEQVTNIDFILWQNNDLVLIYGYYQTDISIPYIEKVFWVEVKSGRVIDVMFSDNSIDSFSYPEPIGSPNRLGFFAFSPNRGFYIYDFITKSITKYENVDEEIFWHSYYGPPEGFQGEASCLP